MKNKLRKVIFKYPEGLCYENYINNNDHFQGPIKAFEFNGNKSIEGYYSQWFSVWKWYRYHGMYDINTWKSGSRFGIAISFSL